MMRYIYALIAIAVITLGYITVANAEVTLKTVQLNVACGPAEEVFQDLDVLYDEQPSLMAYESTGRRIYWTLDDEANSMSLVAVDTDSIACVIWSSLCNDGGCLAPANVSKTSYPSI